MAPFRDESGLGVEHCVSRTVRDTARLLDATHGPGVGDTVIAPAPVRPYVDELGADPGRLRIGILDLFVNAPDTMSAGRSVTFTANAGEATLVLEARDSLTRALLARVVDRRETRGIPGPTNRVTNTSEFRMLANSWSGIAASRLKALQEISPIPDPLTPGQRLP